MSQRTMARKRGDGVHAVEDLRHAGGRHTSPEISQICDARFFFMVMNQRYEVYLGLAGDNTQNVVRTNAVPAIGCVWQPMR